MNEHTIIRKQGRTVECRICGLNFVLASEQDQESHEHEHRVLVCGGLPLQVREFLKAFGWAVAHNDGGIQRQNGKWDPEIGKRAVVFGYWARALTNGVPENDFDRFMAAHFAYVDSRVTGDTKQFQEAGKSIKQWEQYAG